MEQNLDSNQDLIKTLKARFEKNMNRHEGLLWVAVQKVLEAKPEKLSVIGRMEITGGEPDVVEFNQITGEYIFYDCSPESPKERRSLCYDRDALTSRKEFKPIGNAIDMATEIGIKLLTEEQYRHLQTLGEFDLKTSSWLQAPEEIRKLGGSIFGDRRYNTVFIFHNGAESYYSSRGFRGCISI